MHNMMEAAYELDEETVTARNAHARLSQLRKIAREAREHGCYARVLGTHVLVTSGDGGVLATRSAVRLARWLY
jgi:hypothetical protein